MLFPYQYNVEHLGLIHASRWTIKRFTFFKINSKDIKATIATISTITELGEYTLWAVVETVAVLTCKFLLWWKRKKWFDRGNFSEFDRRSDPCFLFMSTICVEVLMEVLTNLVLFATRSKIMGSCVFILVLHIFRQ